MTQCEVVGVEEMNSCAIQCIREVSTFLKNVEVMMIINIVDEEMY